MASKSVESCQNLREVGERIEALLGELRGISPQVAERAETLVQLLVDLYGAGLRRIVETLDEAGGTGRQLLDRIAEDPLLSSLLVLHDLHPVPLEERIQRALDRVRPYLGSHAGGVTFLGVDDQGVVHLRLEGTCHGCPSSTVTVKLAIERAVQEAAPEVTGVEVEGMAVPFHVVPGGRGTPSGPKWVHLGGLGGVLPGQLVTQDAGGERIVVLNVRGSLYAYRDRCPTCGAPIHTGRLEDDRLVCSSCQEAYHVRLAGRSLTRVDRHLEPLPLVPEEGGWKVAVPVSP